MRDATVTYDPAKDFLTPVDGISPEIHGSQGAHPITPGEVSDTPSDQQDAEWAEVLAWQPDQTKSIELSDATITFDLDDDPVDPAVLTVVGKFGSDNLEKDLPGRMVEWESDDEEVATVHDGVVTIAPDAQAADTCEIKATFRGKSDTCTVTVTDTGA